MSDFVPLPLVESSLPHPRPPTSGESLNVPRPFWSSHLTYLFFPNLSQKLNKLTTRSLGQKVRNQNQIDR
nr:hypothetical protein Q903MT_gene5350 [Picea sitchensis]